VTPDRVYDPVSEVAAGPWLRDCGVGMARMVSHMALAARDLDADEFLG
jgi:hypothetical protein